MKRIKALINCFLFKVCPKCNSDAPLIDTCDICNSYRSGFSGMPNDELLGKWWSRHYKFEQIENYCEKIKNLHKELK